MPGLFQTHRQFRYRSWLLWMPEKSRSDVYVCCWVRFGYVVWRPSEVLACRLRAGLKAGCSEDPLLNGFFVNDVLTNDLIDLLGGHFGVPDAIRPNQKNRTSLADSQTVNFASEDNSFRSITVFQSKLPDEPFQFIPGRQACFWVAAFCFGGGGAEQQVMADLSCGHAATAGIGMRVVPLATCSRTARRAHWSTRKTSSSIGLAIRSAL